MKLVLFIILTFCFVVSRGQQVVIHRDLMEELNKNTATKAAKIAAYNQILEKVKKSRENISSYTSVIESVQGKIFQHLTNVSSALRQSARIISSAKQSKQIFDNLQKIIQLSIRKPYGATKIVPFVTATSLRTNHLVNDIQTLVLSNKEDFIASPVERDILLTTILTDLHIIVTLTDIMVDLLQKIDFQSAVWALAPSLDMGVAMDKGIVQEILWRYKLLGHF